MTYTLAIATEATRDLVVEALKTAAEQRSRVARGASSKVAEAKAAGKDVRSQAVKVIGVLAEADELYQLAARLEAAEDLLVIAQATMPANMAGGGGGGIDLSRLENPTPLDATASGCKIEDGVCANHTANNPACVLHQPETAPEPDPDDDGLSDEAHRLAELAGLTDPIIEDDVDTGAIPEDDTDDPEEVLS